MPQRYRPGERICEEGAPADWAWFVKRGLAIVSRGAGGRRAVEAASHVVSPGGLVGLEALVSPVYAATARAAGDATLCVISRGNLDAWLGARGSPARAILEQIAGGRSLGAPRAASPDGTAVARVARWLLGIARDGVAPPLERRVVASLLGMAPETLSRALAKLKRAGGVTISGRHLRIRQRPLLESLAAPGSRPDRNGGAKRNAPAQ